MFGFPRTRLLGQNGAAQVLSLFDVPAAAVNIVAQQAVDFDIAAGFTQPTTPRNVQVVFSATWDGGNVEVTGTDARGNRVVTTIVDPGGAGTVEGTVPYAVILRLRNLGTRTAGTVDVQTGPRLGLPVAPAVVFKEVCDGANEAVGTVNASNGTVVPTTAPNGAHDYVFWCR